VPQETSRVQLPPFLGYSLGLAPVPPTGVGPLYQPDAVPGDRLPSPRKCGNVSTSEGARTPRNFVRPVSALLGVQPRAGSAPPPLASDRSTSPMRSPGTGSRAPVTPAAKAWKRVR